MAYTLWNGSSQTGDGIRIGVCADLDMPMGKEFWQGAVLAAEQVNAEGGIMGRNFTIVAEDDDSQVQPYDLSVGINALTKLITVDGADFILSYGAIGILAYQDLCCEHKKIIFNIGNGIDDYSQRVLDNYEKYKYSFRTYPPNVTMISQGLLGDIITVSNHTGFTKVALLQHDLGAGTKQQETMLTSALPEHGLELVYSGFISLATTDFTSYFAAIEASGAEILFPFIVTEASIPFVKEWYDRQSPFVLWGVMLGGPDFWELTEGKCDTVSVAGSPIVSGYPLTNKTVSTRQAYIQRWGEIPDVSAAGTYDALRFILSDAIKRAGTTETEAVIKALEATTVETSVARRFVFSSSHDAMVGAGAVDDPAKDYMVMCVFQWQDGTQVLVKPKSIMEEAGATYKYPLLQGPWSK